MKVSKIINGQYPKVDAAHCFDNFVDHLYYP